MIILFLLQGSNSEFDACLVEITAILSPDQFQLFEQEFIQLMMSEFSEDIDIEQVELKFANWLEKYLGSNSQNLLKKRQVIAAEDLDDLKVNHIFIQ